MAIKKGDFVRVEYTGRLKDEGTVFDTTDAKVAKDAGIFSEKAEYKPITICVGEKHILPGIDEFIEGKDVGEHKVELPAEKAFGKKKAELLQMIPMSMFAEQKIKPVPGLQLNIDGSMGVVKTVSGGRVVVDFNHPLASKEVVYNLKIDKVVTDKKDQVEATLRVLLGLRDPKVELKEKKATITLPKLPPQILTELKKKIEELVEGIEIEFKEPSEKEVKKMEEEHAKTCDDPSHNH